MKYIDPLTQQAYFEAHLLDDLQVGFGINSWHIKIPLSECRNLFGKNTSYQTESYVCKCGREKIFITSKDHSVSFYVCSQCKNNIFTDVTKLTNKNGECLVNVDREIRCHIGENYACARLFVSVPYGVDLIRDKVLHHQKNIFEMRIYLDGRGETHHLGDLMSSDVQEETYEELLRYIGEHYLKDRVTGFADLCLRRKTLKQRRKAIDFFLKYPKLHDAEFILWPMDKELYLDGGVEKTPQRFLEYIRRYRTEKSIKRTLYKRYTNEISVGKFDALTPFVLCRAFQDSNLVCRLLGNDKFIIAYEYGEDYILKNIAASHIRLLEFLMSHYTQNQIATMFEHMDGDPQLWEDSVSMFNNLFETEEMIRHFRYPRANIAAIHDELVYCRHLIQNSFREVNFSYTDAERMPCVVWKERFELLLPQTSKELLGWSARLNNCLYGYVDHLFNNKTKVYGVKEGGKLCYAIEIRDNKLVQMRGRHNTRIKDNHRDALLSWYHCYFGKTDEESVMRNGEVNE